MENQIIKKAIEIAGSQTLLAEKSGVSQAAIHKLLTRKSKGMNSRTAKALSGATGISLEELLSQ